MSHVVDIQGLTRSFGGPNILDDVALDIAPGEFVALLGRSGSGKSTLLRIMAGLDQAPARKLVLPARRSVVFQESRLLPWKSVRENVTLGLKVTNAAAKASKVLQEVGLEHRTDAWPLTLSGGEAQRAALARALVREPELLLLDEPFASLDALTRLKMHTLVADLWRKHKPAVLLVTHDVWEAVALADRVLVLEHGRFSRQIAIDLPHPRHRADARAAKIEAELLEELGVGAEPSFQQEQV
ncbi:ABC transporter ATP-binding protein [Limoniibacter endophyticus]|uniref:Aliphatic sulfonates import ATP-binding protein SsuB 1 n=1 Tax=Limoniibacter endophyticus TaxID=1565040 RepID=A0A8J3GIE4_9HYPH|nr:ABC transporter ATP-binding protein [Limoniibacter endophyticus]GHC71648.1 aliphatic sulfonates import ATP-binding protein SsuB 1 [Limoniibacter endophyticus]